ncbi:MAG: DNA (cytosine-5-)-methyltransferase [Pseudanabaena frigida]|uniref:DNA (cytosine-5-)-methyltransferase n=1 Tax=Pseudanabaena frigida TaxID=945775 RepID=A0A2W4WH65_9CYAN|nr:MAG: DNA (cytosine-5-)-methyltransferase [Pseudanabaena frigida]
MSKLRQPRVLDLFCGAGGLSLGFQNAGCKIIGGIEINRHAIRTHHKNFPDTILNLPATDITQFNFSQLDIEPGGIDILIGSPPCQVFSAVGIGKMRHLGRTPEQDLRSLLYLYFVEFLNYFKPQFFVMENVNTLKNKPIFSTMCKELSNGTQEIKKSYPGYEIKYQILLSADYGVPQLRKRLFVIGKRKDTNFKLIFPEKISSSEYVSVGQAISDLPELKPICMPLGNRKGRPKQIDEEKPYICEPSNPYQKKMRERQERNGILNHICRSHNDLDLQIFGIMKQGDLYRDIPDEFKRYRSDIFEDKYKRLRWDSPSWTLTAHMKKDGLAYIHPTQTRSISVREAARLHSFPDDFIFDVPMTAMFELIGNSVPPLMAEAIAKPIVKQLQTFHGDHA